MSAELILACVVGFLGGVATTIVFVIGLIKRLVRITSIKHVEKGE